MGTDSTQPVVSKHLYHYPTGPHPQPLTDTTMATTPKILIFAGLLLALVAMSSAFPAADPEAYAVPEAHRVGYRRPSYSHYRPSYSSYRPSYRPTYSHGSYSRPSYSHHRW